ncbi:uncharacterized protein PITG_16667 [Phytophthora infestans T30-4]|uniref:EF-hand domain-containing protein n=1 Tax=Phytophthora infestans (strain T30-4) TaxID=403677 RepID=D0NVB9_PHYIT|nr:uncharacterized protein PITG_16667 [Phytophthora infestans T30-4]EEY66596.1 conserved hypothetical protein [Phytophthora infestans T30-4]|eukprot:XP_002896897.1 conserved hypothetical protein [Phytophthora infestans T30-4]
MDELVAQVLPPDSVTKLLRVFCFLRQHDRKTRIVKKTSELNAWRSSPQATSEEPDGDSVPTMHELRSEIKELQKGVITGSTCSDTSGVITAADLSSCMRSLNRIPTKGEVQWMIWEVDDDLDGSVSWEEFKGCYVRTLLDSHGLELNQLYYLIQFLLCDTDSSQTVSADEITAELQRIGGTEHLTTKLWSVLEGENEEQQLLRKLSLSEFLDAMLGDLPACFNLH